jgi:hypothetical protein
MKYRASLVKPLPDYRLYVELTNGATGVFDMKPYMKAGIQLDLIDPNVFNRVGLEQGIVTWPNGLDLSPFVLFDDLQPVQNQ